MYVLCFLLVFFRCRLAGYLFDLPRFFLCLTLPAREAPAANLTLLQLSIYFVLQKRDGRSGFFFFIHEALGKGIPQGKTTTPLPRTASFGSVDFVTGRNKITPRNNKSPESLYLHFTVTHNSSMNSRQRCVDDGTLHDTVTMYKTETLDDFERDFQLLISRGSE